LIIDKEGEYCYTFNDEEGCLQEGSYLVGTTNDFTNVFIPNSFSPNEDGLNDLFKPVLNNRFTGLISVNKPIHQLPPSVFHGMFHVEYLVNQIVCRKVQ